MPNRVREQAFRDISSAKLLPLGSVDETTDGRRYRYALAGGVTLAAGKLVTSAAVVANHINLTSTAVAVGADQALITLGATAATADQYADGWLVVNSSTGAGINYRIRGHAAVSSGGVLTANLSEPVKVALTTSSKVSFIANPYSGVIISAAAVALRAVGVPNVSVTNAFYGWLQTKGDCSMLSDGVIGKASGAIISDAVNGAVEVEVAGTVTQRVGTAPEATVDAEYRLINLSLE